MQIPKFGFGISLVAFLLPFLLITCNNKKTVEYKPLVMQDQLVYTVQGYKIMINSLDKSDEYREGLQGYNSSDMLYGKSKNMVWAQLLLVIAFAITLSGLLSQFFMKQDDARKRASITFASLVIVLLLSFYIYIECSLSSKQDKAYDSLAGFDSSYLSALTDIVYTIGLGSGFYLCILGQLIVLYYYLIFSKKYSVVSISPNINPNADSQIGNPPKSHTNVENQGSKEL